jgi:hypothetical protein
MQSAVDRISKAEACAALCLTATQLDELLGDPAEAMVREQMLSVRHLLALKLAHWLLPLVHQEVAIKIGVTAGHGAQVGGTRLLVVAFPAWEKDPQAFWRDHDASFAMIVPAVIAPADAWLTALAELVADHRREATRPN